MQIIKKYRNFLILFAFFCFLFIYSVHIPLNLGDDYVYQFLFDQKVLYKPLAEDAVRISSWGDVLYALKQHYLYWHGRLTNHFMFLSMLYIGKPYSDFITASMSIALFILVYWYSQKGEISFNFDTKTLCIILAVFWMFTNHWLTIFTWIGGATNYLYTSVFILLFLLPYLRYYYDKPICWEKYLNVIVISAGLIVGCTNENSIPPILFILSLLFLKNHKDHKKCPLWAKLGFLSMLVGFMVFLTAPSTKIRIIQELYEHKNILEDMIANGNLYSQKDLDDTVSAIERCKNGIPFGWVFKHNLYNNCIALFFATNMYLFLILYIVCGIFLLHSNHKVIDKKDSLFLKLLLLFSFLSVFSLIASPFIVLRSVFFALVSLTISVLVIRRLLDKEKLEMFTSFFKKFICTISCCYIIYSVSCASYLCWEGWGYYTKFINFVNSHPNTKIVVELPKDFMDYKYIKTAHYPPFFRTDIVKGRPVRYSSFKWLFVAFARYYHLKDFVIMYSEDVNEITFYYKKD